MKRSPFHGHLDGSKSFVTALGVAGVSLGPDVLDRLTMDPSSLPTGDCDLDSRPRRCSSPVASADSRPTTVESDRSVNNSSPYASCDDSPGHHRTQNDCGGHPEDHHAGDQTRRVPKAVPLTAAQPPEVREGPHSRSPTRLEWRRRRCAPGLGSRASGTARP